MIKYFNTLIIENVITKFDSNLSQIWSIILGFKIYEDEVNLSSAEDFLLVGGTQGEEPLFDIFIIQIDTSNGSIIKTFTL